MKRLKVLFVLFVCMAVMGVVLVMGLLAWLVYCTTWALLKVLEAMKAVADSTVWLASDLCATRRAGGCAGRCGEGMNGAQGRGCPSSGPAGPPSPTGEGLGRADMESAPTGNGWLGVYLYIIHSYHPAGAGNFLAAYGPLGGLYTVLSFPQFSNIYQIPNDRT